MVSMFSRIGTGSFGSGHHAASSSTTAEEKDVEKSRNGRRHRHRRDGAAAGDDDGRRRSSGGGPPPGKETSKEEGRSRAVARRKQPQPQQQQQQKQQQQQHRPGGRVKDLPPPSSVSASRRSPPKGWATSFARTVARGANAASVGRRATIATRIRTRTERDMIHRRRAPDVITVLCVNEDDGCEMVGVECEFSSTSHDPNGTITTNTTATTSGRDDHHPSSAVHVRRYSLSTVGGESIVVAEGEDGKITMAAGGGSSSSSSSDEDSDVDSDDDTDGSREDEAGDGAGLGKNGWHRALTSIVTAPIGTSSTLADNKSRSTSNRPKYASSVSRDVTSPRGSATTTLDHLTATQMLKNSCPTRTGDDEYDAIAQEHAYLLQEAWCLERDRLELERLFRVEERRERREEEEEEDDVERMRGEGKGGKTTMTYRKFRTNLKYGGRGVNRKVVSSLPVTWLEDISLDEDDEDIGDRYDGKKKKKMSSYSLLDERRRETMRNFRGTGLALLVADPHCEASILRRYRHREYATVQTATLIDDGGAHLTHCAITGIDNILREDASSTLETSYFLKFDAGPKARRQRRAGGGHRVLPPNLVERLLRERRDRASIMYLSTGASYPSGVYIDGGGIGHGSHRCYYAEFDDGECWWGTNGDNVLDRIFTKMDVHRVAFGLGSGGGKSSWIVIGKDGSVTWRNVPPGLHKFLIALDSAVVSPIAARTAATTTKAIHCPATAAPCEVSLGIGGAYFVRLMDGTIDYSLPNFVADVIDELETDDKQIRNVALHVDTSDCLIRYSTKGED